MMDETQCYPPKPDKLWSGLETTHFSVANHSRWRSLRDYMINVKGDKPRFRSRCILNGYVSNWDGEWTYHFSGAGFKNIEWFELRGDVLNDPQMIAGIVNIQFVGKFVGPALRLYGYLENGQVARKLTIEDFVDH